MIVTSEVSFQQTRTDPTDTAKRGTARRHDHQIGWCRACAAALTPACLPTQGGAPNPARGAPGRAPRRGLPLAPATAQLHLPESWRRRVTTRVPRPPPSRRLEKKWSHGSGSIVLGSTVPDPLSQVMRALGDAAWTRFDAAAGLLREVGMIPNVLGCFSGWPQDMTAPLALSKNNSRQVLAGSYYRIIIRLL